MKNSELAKAFVDGATKGEGSHMFIEDNIIYSYGHHFPIAIRLLGLKYKEYVFFLTTNKHSVSTSRHTSYIKNAVGNNLLKEVSGSKILELMPFKTYKEIIAENLE